MKNSNAKTGASPRLTLIATSLGFVLIILDVTVVNVAVERVEVSLHAGVTGLGSGHQCLRTVVCEPPAVSRHVQ